MKRFSEVSEKERSSVMKFSLKILLWTIIVMALALGFSGFYFVNYVFETSLEREVGQAMDESSILGFAFETAALSVPAKYSVLPNNTVEEIASNLERGGQSDGRLLRISDEEKNVLYTSDGFGMDDELLLQTGENIKTYRIIQEKDKYYVHTGTTVNALNRILYLENMKDVSEVFTERTMGFSLYRKVTLVMLFAGMLIMQIISSLLTKPVRLLTEATKRMAAGDYAYRAKQISQDELGQLTKDFNSMAGALEQNIEKLEEEIEAKEEFMGAFAHELKTPLTAIIGYADMLNSLKLTDAECHDAYFYIYSQGKRLESLSHKLLELVSMDKNPLTFRAVPTKDLEQNLRITMRPIWKQRGIKGKVDLEKATLQGDSELLLSLLYNLMDNAVKALDKGEQSFMLMKGVCLNGLYEIKVVDNGRGIPAEEISRITEAFYMVDKSRSRKEGGAGIGMALCQKIIQLHGGMLKVESRLGEGTVIRVMFPRDIAAARRERN